jgi:translation initiation factor 3 subunit E
VLLDNYDEANEDLTMLKDALEKVGTGGDSFTATPLPMQLQQKAWLMHWALFVFFNHENGMNSLIDMFLNERYIVAIQMLAPHLLRYLAVATVINSRRRDALDKVIRVVQQERYEYADPVTEFLLKLFVEYDFDGAQEELSKCKAVLDGDFFLQGKKEEFMEAARTYLFETYCRIHQAIDVRALGVRAAMDEAATEKWLVNLIRKARLNAKIDSKAGTVVVQNQTPGAYEQLLDKARGLSVRTFAVANTVVGLLKV